MADTIEVSTLTKMFEEYVEFSADARTGSHRSRDYYDGGQLPPDVAAKLKKRNQPQTVNNQIQPMVDGLKGAELNSRTDPKAFATTPQHEQDAFAATDAIRHVANANKFDGLASDVYEDLLIEGLGGVEVIVKGKGKKRKIVINHIPFERSFFDYHSRKNQITDMQYSGTVTWDDLDNVKAKWPKAATDLDLGMGKSPVVDGSDTFADTPDWFSSKRNRVMYIEIYFLHNQKWMRAVVTEGIFLEKAEESPYKDVDGEPVNPQILASAKRGRRGNRYGVVIGKLSMQDDINARNIKATDAITRVQTFSKGQLDDIRKFKEQANDSAGHLVFPQGKGQWGKDFGIVPNDGLTASQFEMYKESVRQFKALASGGGIIAGNETNLSGKALRRVDANRNLEIQPVNRVLTEFKIRVYEAIWERIKQFKKDEWWVRVTGDPKNVKWVGLNRPKTIEDGIIERFGQVPPEIANDPRLKELMRDEDGKKTFMNVVAEMNMELFLEDVPDVINLQAEQVEILAELFKVKPEDRILNAIIDLMPIRDKAKILGEDLSDDEKQQKQVADQLKQKAAGLELAGKEADVEKTKASTMKTVTEAKQTAIENFILERLGPNAQPTSFSI